MVTLKQYWAVPDFDRIPLWSSKKEGHIALHVSIDWSVGMLVSLNLVQLITQEQFAEKLQTW